MNRKINVAVAAVPQIEGAMKRLLRVAKKLELTPLPSLLVRWDTKHTKTRKRVISEEIEGAFGATELRQEVRAEEVDVVSVDITLPDEVKAAGEWHLIGTLQRAEHGLEATAVRGAYLPKVAPYRDDNRMECDHCRANRVRVKTLIIEDSKGNTKQVGRECADAYLTDLARVVGELEFKDLIHELLPMDDGDFFDPEAFIGGWGCAKVVSSWDIDHALAFICQQVRVNGFVPSRTTDKWGHELVNDHATWRRALKAMGRREPQVDPADLAKASLSPAALAALNPAERETVQNAIDRVEGWKLRREEWLRDQPMAEDHIRVGELLQWIENVGIDPKENEFLATLQDLALAGWVTERKLAFLAALPGAKDRADHDAKRKMMEANRTEQAPVGRVTVEGKVINVSERRNDFGTTWKMTVELDNGCRVWSTIPSDMHAKVGERVKFTATFERSEKDPFFSFGRMPKSFKEPAPKKSRKAKLAEQTPELAIGGAA